MSELPAGWQRTIYLRSLNVSRRGRRRHPMVLTTKIKALPSSRWRTCETMTDTHTIKHFISNDADENQKRSRLQTGDILFSIAGTIGETALVQQEHLPANTNQALAIIRGISEVFEPRFLQYQLRSQIGREQFNELKRGGGMSNISLGDLGKFSVIVPPLDEQRRMVAKLEKLLSRVNTAQERLATIPRILKRFRQSVLAAACSGKLTADWRHESLSLEAPKEDSDYRGPCDVEIPASWTWESSRDTFDFVTSGSRGWARYYSDSGVVFLRVGILIMIQ